MPDELYFIDYHTIAKTTFSESHVQKLEQWIDKMDNQLPELKNFILPVSFCECMLTVTTMCYQAHLNYFISSLEAEVVQRFTLQEQFVGELKGGN